MTIKVKNKKIKMEEGRIEEIRERFQKLSKDKMSEIFRLFLNDWISLSEASEVYDPKYKNMYSGEKKLNHPTVSLCFEMLKKWNYIEHKSEKKVTKRESKFGKIHNSKVGYSLHRINLSNLFVDYLEFKLENGISARLKQEITEMISQEEIRKFWVWMFFRRISIEDFDDKGDVLISKKFEAVMTVIQLMESMIEKLDFYPYILSKWYERDKKLSNKIRKLKGCGDFNNVWSHLDKVLPSLGLIVQTPRKLVAWSIAIPDAFALFHHLNNEESKSFQALIDSLLGKCEQPSK